MVLELGMVVHTCNSSYLGGSSKKTIEKVSPNNLGRTNHKVRISGSVAQGKCPPGTEPSVQTPVTSSKESFKLGEGG